MQKYFTPAQVEIIAYCLMPNHYHLLVCLNSDDLARVMQPFALSYSKAIAKRFGRTGTLFQGPFKSRLVDKNEYLLHLSRYIHLNPVFAGLAAKPEDWEFSSYRDYIDLRSGTFVRPEIILSQFGREAYRLFVEEYRKEDLRKIEHLMFDFRDQVSPRDLVSEV